MSLVCTYLWKITDAEINNGQSFGVLSGLTSKITRTHYEPQGYYITLKRFKYSVRLSLYVYIVLQIESFVFE